MRTDTLISPPAIDSLVKRPPVYTLSASLCLLISDFVALSVVFWFAVVTKKVFNSHLDFKVYLEIFPSVLIFLGVFHYQGLYPALLVHPAEEIRRIFYSVTAVFLLLVSTTFLLKDGAAYSRFIFFVSWIVGTPMVLLGRVAVRRAFSRTSWWAVPAVVLGSGSAARLLVKNLNQAQTGVQVVGVLVEGPVSEWSDDLPPRIGDLSDVAALRLQQSVRYAILAMPHR
jgi:FlaA1/EpsC-like NDP-sugar epimerase